MKKDVSDESHSYEELYERLDDLPADISEEIRALGLLTEF
jgi:hypothetical protein